MAIVDTLPAGFRPQQITGALTILQQRRHLLADQPGSGKTLQAMLALELDGQFQRRANILILAPMTACQLTWAGEIRRRIDSQYQIVMADLTDTRGTKTVPSLEKRDDLLASKKIEADFAELPLIVLANFETIRWRMGTPPKLATLFGIEWDAIIIDESHLVLPTTEDKPAKVTQFWYGLMALKYGPNPIVLPMSGTPDRGKLWNRYGTWKLMHPVAHRDYWGWVGAHFEIAWIERGYNPKTRRAISIPDIGRLKSPEHWVAYEQQHMTRRTKAEMLEGLPPKQWADDGGIDLPMTPAQRKAYENYCAELEQEISDAAMADDNAKISSLRLQFPMRSRQLATCTWRFDKTTDVDGKVHTHAVPLVAGPESSNKLTWIIQWLSERGFIVGDDYRADGGKVVIVSYFAEVLRWLHAELLNAGVTSVEIMEGSTSRDDKLATEAAFQQGELRIVLLSGHLGVSINLDAADDMIFIDSVHDPDRMEQAEDRIHRASRNHVVTYWRLASIGTVDQATIEIIDGRYRATRLVYDGARGVDFARKMLSPSTEERAA